MTNDEARRPEFDLEERTARFGEAVVVFAKRIPVNLVTTPLIPQLVRAATSVGANYLEADDADSKKEFRYRIGVARREARETKHQIRMVVAAEPQLREDARPLWQEAKELNLIFGAIRRRGT
jgi:four helix bundle protein